MNTRSHWEHIYDSKGPTQVSWYQDHARLSLLLIQESGVRKEGHLIDVGGGTSTLVDDLIAAGFQHITVLDVSPTALKLARERLGDRAAGVNWMETDITRVDLPSQSYDLWHDRAVFHFLTQAVDREHYVSTVRHAVRTGGHVIIATFAADGPDHCSGLEVARYSPDDLRNEFGMGFELAGSRTETHHTPSGTEQKFIYCYFRKS